MNDADPHPHAPRAPGQEAAPALRVVEQLTPDDAFELVSASTRLLFANGQTTERIVVAAQRLANGFGYRAEIFPRWGQITLRLENDLATHYEIVPAQPAGVDMTKVAGTMDIIERVCAGRTDAAAAKAELEAVAGGPPVALTQFTLLAAAGAAALGVIFGERHLLNLVLIALSAGAGALLRRWLAGISHNLFVPPFAAALLAGAIGAVAGDLHLDSALRLIAVCPCMVLVPGPHLLNGVLDIARARISIGSERIVYAVVITLTICAGLLTGLALGGANLPGSAASEPVPLAYDVLAAGVAVAAYGTFFHMPWKILPIPIAVGMAAHACRWLALTEAGANPATGAFLACLLVGTVITPIADRLRLPFAGLAFASVVSLIPGVYLFRMSAGLVVVADAGAQTPPEVVAQVIANGAMALLIGIAMAFGLAAPRVALEPRAPTAPPPHHAANS